MFHLDLPNVYKVLTNGEFKLNETVSGSGTKSGGVNGGESVPGENSGGEEKELEGKCEWRIRDDGRGKGKRKEGREKQIVVISVFGSSFYQTVPRGERSRYKRAFQLAMDAFGTVGMYQGGDKRGDKEKGEVDGAGEAGGGAGGDGRKEGDGENEEEDERGKKRGENHLTSQQIAIGGKLEGFLNEDESVLFLHIEGFAYDAASCMEACQELRSSIKESGFLSVWSSFNTSYCKWLLLLFSLSHVMILSETGGSFDTSYISLFRALDATRQEVLSSVSKILSTIDGLPRQWIDHARLCSPRLVFLFEIETPNPTKFQRISPSLLTSEATPTTSSTSSGVKIIPVNERWERKDMLQNEIYQIFRKCRIITNISANSLFAVPSNEDFVYMFDKSAQNVLGCGVSQSLSYTYLDLISTSNNLRKNLLQKPSSLLPSRSSSNTNLPLKSSFRSTHETLTYTDTVHSFQKFLLDHISVALDKGFDDDYRRVSGNKHFFVLPTLAQWEQAYRKLFHFLIVEPSGSKRISDAYLQMERFINVNSEYLEMQCADMFPKVFAAYQRSLPDFYTAQQHQQKLSFAVQLLLNISRGPGVIPWLKKLAEKCEKHWKNGRQQCETLSLLGHVCSQPVHRIRRRDHLEIVPLPNDMDPELPELPHSSSSRLTSYCNCGKRQQSREEPFTIRQANFEFYRKAGRDCCDKLESYEFSVFTPSQDENVAGEQLSLQEMIVILQRKSESLISVVGSEVAGGTKESQRMGGGGEVEQNERQVGENGELEEVFEAELRQEEESDEEEELEEEEEEEEEKDSQEGEVDGGELEEKEREPAQQFKETEGAALLSSKMLFKRNSSTVEYLPGMYHSKAPLGLLPLFPSWSLVCLGPSSIYSHSHGVSQHGFLSGANCLLPWDVKVKAEKGVVYVPPSRLLRDRRSRHQRPRREILVSSHLPSSATVSSAVTNEFNVKVFFGFEYECRKGHRFFCDSHEKVLYALNISQATQKTIAGKVIGCDMPLYVYCPCKENRDSRQIAQLLRVHIVTPKAPVFVTVAPKIQPGPGAPIFSPSPTINEEDPSDTIKLTPSTYWILRVPFSYVGDVVYVPPSDISRYNGKLFKGIFNVVSMSTEETEEWEKQNQNRV